MGLSLLGVVCLPKLSQFTRENDLHALLLCTREPQERLWRAHYTKSLTLATQTHLVAAVKKRKNSNSILVPKSIIAFQAASSLHRALRRSVTHSFKLSSSRSAAAVDLVCKMLATSLPRSSDTVRSSDFNASAGHTECVKIQCAFEGIFGAFFHL